MQQVGPGPEIWWRADQPPTPRPTLEAPIRRDEQSRPRGRPLAAVVLCAAAILLLAQPERRMAALANIEHAIELAGFGLRQVTLTGHRFAADRDVYAALDLDNVRTLLSLDARAAQDRVEELPWIESAVVERVMPDGIDVRVVERVPFALWRSGERHWLIDRSGRKLQAVPADTMPELPRVAGEGAAEEAAALTAALSAFPQVARGVEFAERVGERRWTLHLKGGTTAQLPATGESGALARLARLLDAPLDGVNEFDLRVLGTVLVRQRRDGHPSSRKSSKARLSGTSISESNGGQTPRAQAWSVHLTSEARGLTPAQQSG